MNIKIKNIRKVVMIILLLSFSLLLNNTKSYALDRADFYNTTFYVRDINDYLNSDYAFKIYDNEFEVTTDDDQTFSFSNDSSNTILQIFKLKNKNESKNFDPYDDKKVKDFVAKYNVNYNISEANVYNFIYNGDNVFWYEAMEVNNKYALAISCYRDYLYVIKSYIKNNPNEIIDDEVSFMNANMISVENSIVLDDSSRDYVMGSIEYVLKSDKPLEPSLIEEDGYPEDDELDYKSYNDEVRKQFLFRVRDKVIEAFEIEGVTEGDKMLKGNLALFVILFGIIDIIGLFIFIKIKNLPVLRAIMGIVFLFISLTCGMKLYELLSGLVSTQYLLIVVALQILFIIVLVQPKTLKDPNNYSSYGSITDDNVKQIKNRLSAKETTKTVMTDTASTNNQRYDDPIVKGSKFSSNDDPFIK